MGDSYTNKLRVHISTSLPFEIKIFLNVKLTQKYVEITQPCAVKKFKSYSERGVTGSNALDQKDNYTTWSKRLINDNMIKKTIDGHLIELN